MKVIIDSAIPYIRGVVEPYAEVVYCKGAEIDSSVVSNADALVVRTRTECGRELLEGSKVQFIATATIGRDHIDQEYCNEAGIAVTSAAGSPHLKPSQVTSRFSGGWYAKMRSITS